MKLPGTYACREMAEGVSEGEAQLDKLRFLDVVPKKLILQLSLGVEPIQCLPPYKVPREFGVLR